MQNPIDYGRTEQIVFLKGYRFSAGIQRALRDRFVDMLVISIPLLRFLEIKIVGRLFLSEIILICLFPIFLLNKRIFLSAPLPKMMILLTAIWLAGQILTDLILHIPFQDFIRGWAKIAITLIHFAVIYILTYGSRKRIVLYAIGLALGGILCFYFNPHIYATYYPWKFGIGASLTWLLIIFASSTKIPWTLLRLGIIGFASGLNLYMGFRSYAGICFLTATYIFIHWLWGLKDTKIVSFPLKNLVVIGLACIAASFCFLKTYEIMVRQGLLGERAREKYEQQASGKLGVLIGGRSEILVSFRAIMDSPFIGHGSWAKDYRYADTLRYLKRILGYYPGQSNELGLIPTHSHLFGAWVEAGILGAVLWLWVLSLPIRGMAMLIRTKNTFLPLFAFFSLHLIWDILFSPFGGELRIMTPYYIVVIMSFFPMQVKRKRLCKIPTH